MKDCWVLLPSPNGNGDTWVRCRVLQFVINGPNYDFCAVLERIEGLSKGQVFLQECATISWIEPIQR